MLNLAGQLCQWSSDGVELWRDHDHLHYRIPANDLSDAIQSDILAKRTSILELFSDRHNQVGPFPVPPNVRSMLTLEKLQPGHCGHILRYAMTLDFDIDVAKLQTAVDHTMGRHPMLNAAYHWLDNSPYLFFRTKTAAPLVQHTLESLDEDALSEWISTHGTTPFALGDEPLIRFHLASPGQDTGGFVLLIVMHHTIADYHSLETVTNQLTMTYLRLTTEVDSPIEPSALRLNDHCRLQFHSFSGAANQENRDFWVSALPQLTKPASAQIASRKRQTFLGYEHQMIVSPTICHRVKEFAKSMATTEFCVMFAAYALVYQKFFGGDEVIGTTATCRLTHPAPDIIGCYVNPVPVMMANASRDKSFTSWVVWVTRQVNDIMQHSDLAFNDLLALANVPRIPGRPVLIDTLFTWLRDDPRGNRQSGSMIGTIRLAKPLAIGVTHDLVCMVRTAGPDRSLILSHDAAVLDHQNVLQFAERYLEAMEHWLDSPDNMVGSSNDAQSDDLAETHREEFLF